MFNFGGISNVVFALGRNGPAGVQIAGTAFALNKPGFFATASHVAGTDGQGLVLAFKKLSSLNDYQDTGDTSIQTFPVQIEALDPFHDLAVLRADVGLDRISLSEAPTKHRLGLALRVLASHTRTTDAWFLHNKMQK